MLIGRRSFKVNDAAGFRAALLRYSDAQVIRQEMERAGYDGLLRVAV